MINIHCTGASQPETEVKCLQLKVLVEDFLGHQDREPFGPHAITGAATEKQTGVKGGDGLLTNLHSLICLIGSTFKQGQPFGNKINSKGEDVHTFTM